MLEQYGFIKNLFDFSSDKVRASALFSIIINLIITAVGYFNHFANEILGVSAFLAITLFFVMAVDYGTGTVASLREGQKWSPTKGLNGFFKFGSYIAFIYVMNAFSREAKLCDFTWLSYPMDVVKLWVVITICFMEGKSIDKNCKRMGKVFGVFKLMDHIYDFVKGIFKKNNIDIGGDENE